MALGHPGISGDQEVKALAGIHRLTGEGNSLLWGTALKPCEGTDTSATEREEEPGLRRSHPSIIKRCFQRPNGPGVETNLAAFQRKSEQIRAALSIGTIPSLLHV